MLLKSKPLMIALGAIAGLFLLLVILLIAFNIKPQSTISGDFTISLDRGPCFGGCPDYDVTIESDGKVTLNGRNFVEVKGKQTYTIKTSEVEKLKKTVEKLDFFNLEDEYTDPYITDLPSTTITVTSGGKTKSIYLYGFAPEVPENLTDFAEQIDKAAKIDDYLGEYDYLQEQLPSTEIPSEDIYEY